MELHAHRKWPQFLITLLCNMSMLSLGLVYGWLAPIQPALQSQDSPLGNGSRPLTDEEISWIGSSPSMMLLLGSPFFGFLLDKYGRKISLLFATAPNIINYLLLIFADNVYMIHAARVIGGFAASGALSVVPLYISETCEPGFRGLLCGSVGAFLNLGIVMSFVLGGYASYFVLNFVSLMFTVFFLTLYFWMPESPEYLLMKNRKEEAREALIKLRGNDETIVDKELDRIKTVLNETKDRGKKFSLKVFFTSRVTVRALIIALGIFTIPMIGGYPAFEGYIVDILLDSGASFSPHLAAVLIAVAQLTSAITGAVTLSRVGRKTVLLVCLSVMALSLALFTSYIYMRRFEHLSDIVKTLSVLPTICFIAFISGNAFGFNTVRFLIVPELFSTEARATASAILPVWLGFFEFLVSKMYLTVSNWIGMELSFLIFTCNCFFGLTFIALMMFETRDLTPDEIYRKLGGKRENNSCEEKN